MLVLGYFVAFMYVPSYVGHLELEAILRIAFAFASNEKLDREKLPSSRSTPMVSLTRVQLHFPLSPSVWGGRARLAPSLKRYSKPNRKAWGFEKQRIRSIVKYPRRIVRDSHIELCKTRNIHQIYLAKRMTCTQWI